ncbi:MAG: bifunctional precorrin-2 dehydrogenase/sirohydrochlorin ferrochelatase [Rickettsiales bacterium]
MFPIMLDLRKLPVVLIGTGEAFERRHKQLLDYGAALSSPSLLAGEGWGGGCYFARTEFVSSPHPGPLPEGEGIFDSTTIVMIAGLSDEISKQIADAAREAGKLVNVEDVNELCDFYFTANVKRGDLVISVSTSGASPTLARRVRDYISSLFGTNWQERTKEMAEFRGGLKLQNKTISEILEASDEFLERKGWLK